MARLGPGLLALTVLTLMGTSSTVQHGCQDATRSLTHLTYSPKRDMRSGIALLAQRGFYRAPDTLSVPTTGREVVTDPNVLDKTWTNPVASNDSSIARGERKFQVTCIPCHGTSLAGDGPVSAKFVPPPDLLNSSSRGRTDGFMFAHIRHGGPIMPSYQAQVTIPEACDLINYLRHQQKANPR